MRVQRAWNTSQGHQGIAGEMSQEVAVRLQIRATACQGGREHFGLVGSEKAL